MQIHKLMLSALSAGILLASAGAAEALTITNGDFETGDFTGWSTNGSTGIFGAVGPHNPTSGTSQAGLIAANTSDAGLESFLGLSAGSIDSITTGNATVGAAISQSLTAIAGEKIIFDFNFLDDESSTTFVDAAFVSITTATSQIIQLLADSNGNGAAIQSFPTVSLLGSSINAGATGYLTGEIIVPESGLITLGFGIVNEQDTIEDSGLLIDNVRSLSAQATAVPEPATLGLFGIGLVGLGLLKRTRKRA